MFIVTVPTDVVAPLPATVTLLALLVSVSTETIPPPPLEFAIVDF